MSFGWRWCDIDDMLVTDVWEALDGLALEPPAHMLLYSIATALGYKPVDHAKVDAKAKSNVSGDVGPMMAIGGRPKPKSAVPKHIAESSTLQRLFAEMGAA